MRAKLFGLSWLSDSQKAITILEDSKRPYDFVDVGDIASPIMDAVTVLSGKSDLPQLHFEGVTYVGLKSIQAYCGS
jgi:hypothetical protein